MKNIVLIGMPGCGKSTIGVVLAKVLGFDFVDADVLIQKKHGKLLRELIAEYGDDGFLQIENDVNKEIDLKNTVIATGGSVVYCDEAMQHYVKNDIVVYIELPYGVIASRLENVKRRGVVLKDGQTLKDLYNPIPISMIPPSKLITLSVLPVKNNAIKTPLNANGRENMIMNG